MNRDDATDMVAAAIWNAGDHRALWSEPFPVLVRKQYLRMAEAAIVAFEQVSTSGGGGQ